MCTIFQPPRSGGAFARADLEFCRPADVPQVDLEADGLEQPDTTAREAEPTRPVLPSKRCIGSARDVNDARGASAGSSFRSGQGLAVTACSCMVCGGALRLVRLDGRRRRRYAADGPS